MLIDFSKAKSAQQKAMEAALVLQTQFAASIQAHIDATAETRGYANGFALASYVSSTLPSWAAEARAFVAWRDQVWAHAYGELAKVQQGQRTMPGIADFVRELPAIQWP